MDDKMPSRKDVEPDWYSNEMYEYLKELDSAGWYNAFSGRVGLSTMLNLPTDTIDSFAPGAHPDGDYSRFYKYIFSCVIDLNNDHKNKIFTHELPYKFPCILDAEDGDKSNKILFDHTRTTSNPIGNRLSSTSLLSNVNSSNPSRRIDRIIFPMEFKDERFPAHQTYNIRVDLSAPDGVIIDEFKKWLTEKRQTTGVPVKKRGRPNISNRVFDQSDFNSWIDGKIIQIFDLYFWEKVYGITNSQYHDSWFIFEKTATDDAKKKTSAVERLRYSEDLLLHMLHFYHGLAY